MTDSGKCWVEMTYVLRWLTGVPGVDRKGGRSSQGQYQQAFPAFDLTSLPEAIVPSLFTTTPSVFQVPSFSSLTLGKVLTSLVSSAFLIFFVCQQFFNLILFTITHHHHPPLLLHSFTSFHSSRICPSAQQRHFALSLVRSSAAISFLTIPKSRAVNLYVTVVSCSVGRASRDDRNASWNINLTPDADQRVAGCPCGPDLASQCNVLALDVSLHIYY